VVQQPPLPLYVRGKGLIIAFIEHLFTNQYMKIKKRLNTAIVAVKLIPQCYKLVLATVLMAVKWVLNMVISIILWISAKENTRISS